MDYSIAFFLLLLVTVITLFLSKLNKTIAVHCTEDSIPHDLNDIFNFSSTIQSNGTVLFSFGSTRIFTELYFNNGETKLYPLWGDQWKQNYWYELFEDDLESYCRKIEYLINS